MDLALILLPSPFVGYLIADSVRKIFSDDPKTLRRVVADQPVTMIAAFSAVGSVAMWTLLEVGRGLLSLF